MTEAGRITAMIDGDISGLRSVLGQARSEATAAVSGIESDFKNKFGGGLEDSLSGGDIRTAGKRAGDSLVDGLTQSFGPLGGTVGEIATSLGPTGLIATAAIAGTALLGAKASQAAMEWEAGMSQISKTTGIEKGTQEFENLNNELKGLYSTMPTTVQEIQSVAAAAGSLGIERDSIAGFTKVALEMGSAFDMPAEEAATAIGRIKGQLKSLPEGAVDSADFARKFGSAVDYMGNNFNATEKDVLDFSTRVAGSLSSLGGNAYEIAGWGGMLSSVFPSAERAAGSFDALLTQLTTNTDAQSKAAELLGISTEEFMQQMTTDPSGTILSLGKALEGLPTDKLMETAKTLGGAYGMDSLVKMVGHTEEWGDAIKKATQAGEKGESIGSSFQAGANNMKSSLQVLKNSVGAIFQDMGGPINAALTPIIQAAASGLNKIREIGENLWGPITAGLSPLTSGVSALVGTIGTLGGMTLDGLVAGTSAINSAFQTGKAFVSAFAEEITKVVENSSTFQTIKGYVEEAKSAFENAKSSVTGFLESIASGAKNALGSLIDLVSQGLKPVTDAVKGFADKTGISSAIGGVKDFFGNVWDNAMGKLGIKTEEAVAEGTEKGMEKGAEAAKDGVGSAIEETFEQKLGKLLGSKQYSPEVALGLASGMSLSDSMNMAMTHSADSIEKLQLQMEKYLRSMGHDLVFRAFGGSNITNSIMQVMDETGNVLAQQEYSGTLFDEMINNFVDGAKSKLKPAISSIFLDIPDAIRDAMQSTGDMVSGMLKSEIIDPNAIFAKISQLKDLKILDPAAFRAQGGNAGLEFLNGLMAQLDRIDQIKKELKIKPGNAALLAELDALLANVQSLLENAGLVLPIKPEVDTRSLYAQMLEAYGRGETDMRRLGISNIDRYAAYARQQLMGELEPYFKAGLANQIVPGTDLFTKLQEIERVMFNSWDKLDQNNKEWLLSLNELLSGELASDDIYLQLGGKLDSDTAKVEQAIQQSNNLLSMTAENTADMCEAMSDFGMAQERGWNELDLGQESYIGSKAGYEEFLKREEEKGIYHPEVTELGQDNAPGAGKKTIDADISPAIAKLGELDSKIAEEKQKPLKIDDSAAMATIAAIDAAASAPVTKIVYVREVGGGGGGSRRDADTGFDYSALSDLPAFGIGGYAPSRMLAWVGDAPGGEYIVPATQYQVLGAAANTMSNARANWGSVHYGIDPGRSSNFQDMQFYHGTGVQVTINQQVHMANVGASQQDVEYAIRAQGDWLVGECCRQVGYLLNRAEEP